jgi:hypothetical protein
LENENNNIPKFRNIIPELKQYIREGTWENLTIDELVILERMLFKPRSSLYHPDKYGTASLSKLIDEGYIEGTYGTYQITPKGRVAYEINAILFSVFRDYTRKKLNELEAIPQK